MKYSARRGAMQESHAEKGAMEEGTSRKVKLDVVAREVGYDNGK